MEMHLNSAEYVWLEKCLEPAALLLLRYSGDDDTVDEATLRRLLERTDGAAWESDGRQGGNLLVLLPEERQAISDLITALTAADAETRRQSPGRATWRTLAADDLSELLGRQPRGSLRRERLSALAC